jgi:GWxTD domain-containing protein
MAVCFSIIPKSSDFDQNTQDPDVLASSRNLPTRIVLIGLISLLVFFSHSSVSLAGIIRPLEGQGNFHSYFDVLNRWQDNEHLDVLVLVEITNADIKYEETNGHYVGKFNFEVILEGPDGKTVTKKRHMSTARLDKVLAASRTSFQVFGLILEDVPFREGRLTCRLQDALKKKAGILNRKGLVLSESVSPWNAEHDLRLEGGVTVGDPLFLAHAPVKNWNPAVSSQGSITGYLHDYIHPSRRYGLEQDKLQLFIPVWPALSGGDKASENKGLQVQIISSDMVYSITDTLEFDDQGVAILGSGRPSGLFYELDLNILPEGSYSLAIAPLNRAGRGQLVMFDVIWRLGALGNRRDQVLGEGHLVLSGRQLKDFLAATPSGQEKILADFWSDLNPDPESPVNTVYMEYLYRLEYVRNFLGGIGPFGANDPRGEVYLFLGPPDDIEREILPMNSSDLNDAQIKTFQQFAPDREGSWAKGEGLDPNPGTGGSDFTPLGIPMPRSSTGEKQIMLSLNTSHNNHGYELWKYDDGGDPIFKNYLMNSGGWKRFLFVDRTGTGEYFLESSNMIQGGD